MAFFCTCFWALFCADNIAFPQQASDLAKEQNDSTVLIPETKETRKSSSLLVPNALPATGIASVLGEQAARPDAVYLRRENGEAVFVPQSRYEEFERYLNAQTSVESNGLPSALVQSVNVTGSIREGVAEVQIYCKVDLAEEAQRVVNIELGLGNCNIQRINGTEGGKRSVLYPAKDATSFVWSIEPDGSREYSIRIDALIKVNRIGLDNSLRLELPYGPTKIDLNIPTSPSRPAANTRWIGNSSEVLETTVRGENLKATVTGRGGTGVLAWNEGATQQNFGALEADTDTRLILNRQSLRWDAVTKLRIRATGRTDQQDIILELPENAVWIPSQSSSLQTTWTLGAAPITATKVDSTNKPPVEGTNRSELTNSVKSKRQRLLLRFSEKGRSFTEEIPIEWRLPTTDKSEQSVLLSSLTIPEAQRHEGRFLIQLPADQQFSWSLTNDFQFLNQSNTAASTEYEFRFARQGGNLSAILRTEQAQVRLKTSYLARVSKSEVQLDGVFQFTQSPASLQELTFDAPGWTLHGLSWVDSADLIPADSISESSLRVVPSSMVDSASSTSTPESRSIRLLASRALPAGDAQELKLSLPVVRWLKSNREQVRERGDGWLYIAPGPFKVLTESMKLSEMTRVNDRLENIQSLFQLPTAFENPLAFRFRSGAGFARWEAPLRLTPRIVAGTIDTNVLLRANGWRIQRQWKLNIQGPSVSQLSFRVPNSFLETTSETPSTFLKNKSLTWDLRIDGTPTAIHVEKDPIDSGFSYLVPDLITPIKKSQIELSTTLVDPTEASLESISTISESPANPPQLREKSSRTVPLVQLQIEGNSTLESNPAIISVDTGLVAETDMEGGSSERFTSLDASRFKRLSETDTLIEFRVSILNPLSSPPVAVDRIWIQTLANATQIRERVVCKVLTNETTLAFKLPTAWDPKTLKIIVDGTPVSFFDMPGADGYRLPISSSNNPTKAAHAVEFWNWFSIKKTNTKELSPNVPEIQGVASNVSCIWQIAVPSEEILVTQPDGWLGDWSWNFTRNGFNRVSSKEQSDFEQEFDCTPQTPLPKSTNQYVLMSLLKPSMELSSRSSLATSSTETLGRQNVGKPETLHVLIVPRYWIWIPVGATLLILSVLWNYSPWFRNPMLWIVFVVALGLATAIAPDIAAIVGQTVLVSLPILAAVQLAKWAWPVRVKRRDGPSNSGASTIISPASPSAVANKTEPRSGSVPTQQSPPQVESAIPRTSKSFASTAAPVASSLAASSLVTPSLALPSNSADNKEPEISPANKAGLHPSETLGTEAR